MILSMREERCDNFGRILRISDGPDQPLGSDLLFIAS